MLYYLIEYLDQLYGLPGAGMLQFITVRSALAGLTALLIALVGGRFIINWLSRKQLGERIREGEGSGVVSHAHKAGTPTMGGVIILLALLGATLLWGAVAEVYVWLVLLTTAWMGAVGFADDYIKTVLHQKEGLSPWVKIMAQVGIGVVVGGVLYFWPGFEDVKGITYLPFVHGKSLNYYFFEGWFAGPDLGWIVYIPVAAFIMTAVSNAVNLTDGLDGLTTGVTAFVSVGFLGLCYIAGNFILADFLDVIFLPGAGELTIFAAAMTAACFGFLWYNGYPATVFMGDTGSLALGAAVGAISLSIRMELLLPVLGAIFFLEALSVIAQTGYFKYTKHRYGKGERLFLMAPFHHHFEARGTHEAKIVTRMWIVTAMSVIMALLVLRVR